MIFLAIGTLWRPSFIFAGIICLFGLEQWLQSRQGIFRTNSSLTNVGMGCLVVLGVIVAMFRQQLNLRDYPKVGFLVIALFGFALISFLWTPDRSAFTQRWILAGPYILTIILMMPLLVRNWQDLQTAFYATLALGTLVLGLLAFNSEWTYRGIAISGLERGNPLAVASFAGHVAIIALLMNFHGANRIFQIARWPIFLLALYISMRSGTRGQTIALIPSVLLFLPLSRRFNSYKGMAATFVGIVFVGVIFAWAQSIWAKSARWEFSEMTESYGLSRFDTVLQLLSEWASAGPLAWIVGLGNSASFDKDILGFYPHVVMGEILGEQGLIGLVLFLSILWFSFRAALRLCLATSESPNVRGVVATIGALLLFSLLISFKQGSLLTSTYLFAFCILLGRVEQSLMTEKHLPAPSTTQQY